MPFDFSDRLRDLNLIPVLFDVGASGAIPDQWAKFAAASVGVSFDPDDRDFDAKAPSAFLRQHRIPKAVGFDRTKHTMTINLTTSPYCSSALAPNVDMLRHYVMAPLFSVIRSVEVPSTTLNEALVSLGLLAIDWLKIDSQGLDARIYHSLDDSTRTKLLAIDIEPGLIPSYRGEDTFPALHEQLISDGFWLASLRPRGSKRCRYRPHDPEFDRIVSLSVDAPCWCEATYLRNPERLTPSRNIDDDLILLAIFGAALGHFAFAIELLEDLQTRASPDRRPSLISLAHLLRRTALDLQPSRLTWFLKGVIRRIKRSYLQ